MALLVNIDVPDLEAAVAFYAAAFGLTVGRRFGGEVVELTGWPAPLYLLRKPAGTIGAGDSRRDYARHWTRCISTWWWTMSRRHGSGRWRPAPWPRARSAPPPGAGWRSWPIRSAMGSASSSSSTEAMTRSPILRPDRRGDSGHDMPTGGGRGLIPRLRRT